MPGVDGQVFEHENSDAGLAAVRQLIEEVRKAEQEAVESILFEDEDVSVVANAIAYTYATNGATVDVGPVMVDDEQQRIAILAAKRAIAQLDSWRADQSKQRCPEL